MDLEQLNQRIVACRSCPRLVAWREQVALEKRRAYQDLPYWGRPVPGFGDPHARVFVVGLAPGAHGSNRTGRQFTGDASGDFLYPALFRAGFASRPDSIHRDDGLQLLDLYTAPVCRCAPPNNRPRVEEMDNCQAYLEAELTLIRPKVIVVLGRIAHQRVVHLMHAAARCGRFGHNLVHPLPGGQALVCSYHPSRQNTQTGRLTPAMFDQVWKTVREILENDPCQLPSVRSS
jgi:uracil-DNA glycosylase family 4